jgi:hypothetical protein
MGQTGLFVGLLNHIGAIQTEVNPVISAYYDWGCYYIKQFVSSSMDVFVRDNYSRMREGYKSRGVVMTIWLKTLHTLSLGKSKNDSIQHLWMDIQGDALGLVNVPMVFCNLLYRGVHMSSLVMTSVLADHLRCPVVSVKNLNRFFELEGPPDLGQEDTSFREDFHNILEFIRLCLTNNRFCPAEDAPLCRLGNISCYISGDANIELMPANPKTSLLRVPPNKDKDETHDISHKVALRVAAQYGEQLFGQCHMGPDVATYRLALVYLMERFAPDFRGLMSPLMFHSAKHLGILGLAGEAPGMSNYLEPAHPPFARQCNIRLRDQQLQSQAIGVNVWSLLTVVSLVGSTDIHPDVSNCFSHSLLQTILAHAPAASTPGDMCPTPRFDHSATATRIFIPDVPRPKHFLRPNEPSFVKNGVLPIAKACGRFTPEDMLHVSQLSSVHKQLHCDIMEVPSNAFTSPYALEPDVRYTFHIPYPDEGEYGMIIVNTEAERVSVETFSRTDEDRNRAHSLTFTDWEEKIREMGMVITPLIRRAGAAVVVTTVDPETQVESQAIGCLIPTPESGEDLLDVSDCTYNALMTAEMDVAKLFFLDVLKESLLPVGEVLYLDMKVLEEEKYQALGRQGKLLFVRLNVPHVRNPEQGKLYVTCLHQPRTSHGRSVRGTTAITLAVNPWDVQLASSYTGNPANVIKHLS